ncbi:Actin-related protein 2 [Exophiala xenobiotica]|nr:Actin-related protein 2 [Exophiala xenobiotica]
MGSKADIRLDGKVALITGAGRGLGAGFAKMLAERGAAVILNYATSAKPALATVAEIEKAGGKAVAIQANVAKVPEVERLFEEAIKAFGKLDIVINNAGMEHFGKTQDVTEEEFDAVFGLNTRAQFFVGSRALRHLSDGGRIIFMSSIAASLSVPNHALYCASKSAAEGLARSFAADGGPRRITCNAIAPGGIKTDMFAQNAWHYSPGATKETPIEEIEAGIAKLIPLNRCAVPDDIAKVVMFLCHDDSEWVTGQTIRLTGGSTIA